MLDREPLYRSDKRGREPQIESCGEPQAQTPVFARLSQAASGRMITTRKQANGESQLNRDSVATTAIPVPKTGR
jgi:hypothetical protein